MKILFLGTPSFAVPSLLALHEKYGVGAVVCQPDKAKDRKGNTIFGAVKAKAIELGIEVRQFNKIREDGVEFIKEFAPDLMVTCAYGQILSQEILDIPKYGVINVHGSLLPLLRGSAPIQGSLINGDKTTGITIMKTALGMDSGDIISQREVEIFDEDYLDDLYSKMSIVGADLLIETLPDYINGKIKLVAQDESVATKCRMITKEDATIDFNDTATNIRNKIRGVGYGCFGYGGNLVKVYKAEICLESSENNGDIICLDKNGLVISCKDLSVRFTELQMSGKKRMSAVDFANGVKMSGAVDKI